MSLAVIGGASSQVLGTLTLPLLRAGLACTAGPGVAAGGVLMITTVDAAGAVVGNATPVLANAAGNTAPPPSAACPSPGVQPGAIPPAAGGLPVTYTTLTLPVNASGPLPGPAAALLRRRRALQSAALSPAAAVLVAAGDGGAASTPLQLQLASVMVALAAALNPNEASAATAPPGYPDYASSNAVALSGGLAAPTAILTAQLKTWASSLGFAVGRRIYYAPIGQLVITVGGGAPVAVTLTDAASAGAALLAPAAAAPPASVAGAVAGGVIGALIGIAAIVAAVVLVRRRRAHGRSRSRAIAPSGVDRSARIPVAAPPSSRLVGGAAAFAASLAAQKVKSGLPGDDGEDDENAELKAATLQPFNPSAVVPPGIVRPNKGSVMSRAMSLRRDSVNAAESGGDDDPDSSKHKASLGQYAAFSSLPSSRKISVRAPPSARVLSIRQRAFLRNRRGRARR